MTVPALLTVAYAVNFMLGTPPGGAAYRASILGEPVAVLHIWASTVAMAVGPFQLSSRLRARSLVLHRWTGRVYLAAVGLGGMSAIYVAKDSRSYLIGAVGFALLGIAWLSATGVAYWMIRRHQVAAHRRWMIRSFALTYAAVMLRWQTPLLIMLGTEAKRAVTIVSFLCWVPNLLFAEWWVRRTGHRGAPAIVG